MCILTFLSLEPVAKQLSSLAQLQPQMMRPCERDVLSVWADRRKSAEGGREGTMAVLLHHD